ncbi:hypothetical protein SLA2020_056710 [Shorea laevis]
MKRFDNVIGKRKGIMCSRFRIVGIPVVVVAVVVGDCEEMERTRRVFRFSFAPNKFSGLKFGALDSD